MKLPKTINVLSEIYTIIEESDYFMVDENILRGHVNYNNHIIRIFCPTVEAGFKTLLHEINHIICHELNLYDETHDEKFIDSFAVGLTDTLIRNKLIKE